MASVTPEAKFGDAANAIGNAGGVGERLPDDQRARIRRNGNIGKFEHLNLAEQDAGFGVGRFYQGMEETGAGEGIRTPDPTLASEAASPKPLISL
jgi:hypothetical protein